MTHTIANQAKSWPYQQARSLLAHIEKKGKKPGDVVTFCTGFGPSGTPHIGTFAEIVRTSFVLNAFNVLTENAYQTRLISFSDDLDALRKVPDNTELSDSWCGYSLSRIPYSINQTFADHNISALEQFCQRYGLGRGPERYECEIEFLRSSSCYQIGMFNETLELIATHHDVVLDIMRRNLSAERGDTYCAFMPILPSGRVVSDGVKVSDDRTHLIHNDQRYEYRDGFSKLQWKVDWAMRWIALDVDYEMSGKDLIDSVRVSGSICRALGYTPPLNMTYELFLDENGEKISKSKGNGLDVSTWLKYGTMGSLLYLMYQNPRQAHRLYVDMIPRVVDDYEREVIRYDELVMGSPHLDQVAAQEPVVYNSPSPTPVNLSVEMFDLPVTHIEHYGNPNSIYYRQTLKMHNLTFQMLINVAQMLGPATEVYDLARYVTGSKTIFNTYLNDMCRSALDYTADRVFPNVTYREPTDLDRAAVGDLITRLQDMSEDATEDEYQFQVYEVGKAHPYPSLRDWFKAIYEIYFGSDSGPRLGNFIKVYGLDRTIEMLRSRLDVR